MKFIKMLVVLILPFAVVLVKVGVSQAIPYRYATAVRWDNGANATPSGTVNSRYNQASALGSPNANTTSNTGFLSLGIGGLAVFDFGAEFDAAAVVFETTGGNRQTYPTETARIYVAGSSYAPIFAGLNTGNGLATLSTDGFTLVGSVTNKSASTLLDFSPLDGPFRYLLVQDMTTGLGAGPGYDGFDLDAVGVTPIPEPGTVLLVGLGMAGVAVGAKFRRRRQG